MYFYVVQDFDQVRISHLTLAYHNPIRGGSKLSFFIVKVPNGLVICWVLCKGLNMHLCFFWKEEGGGQLAWTNQVTSLTKPPLSFAFGHSLRFPPHYLKHNCHGNYLVFL